MWPLDALCCDSHHVTPVGMGGDVAAWQRPRSGATEALGMCPQQASLPSKAGLRVTFRLCRGLAATPWEALCQHRAWVSFRKGRGTWLGNGVIPARQLGELRLQSQMVQGRLRGAGTEIQDHLSRCRRTRGCGSTPSRWSLIHRHQQKPCSQTSGGSTMEPKIVLPAVEFKV